MAKDEKSDDVFEAAFRRPEDLSEAILERLRDGALLSGPLMMAVLFYLPAEPLQWTTSCPLSDAGDWENFKVPTPCLTLTE